MRFPIAVASLLLFAHDLPFQEKVEVRLIEVNAVVTDHAGNRVYGLTPDDFEVREGRTQQKITNFSEYRATPEAQREPHSLAIVIDALPRESFIREKAFAQLDAAVPKLMHPGDYVSVIYWEEGFERPRVVAESTDPNVVTGAIRSLNAGNAQDIDSARAAMVKSVGKTLGAGELQISLLRRKTAAFQRIIDVLGTRPGRKALLYVSTNLSLIRNDGTSKRLVDSIATAANANGVTIYSVRPATSDTSALERLTDPTGGLLDIGRNSVGDITPRIAADLDSYYSIAYRALSDGSDRERNIAVRAKNPSYSVRVRRAVIDKSNETKAKETTVSRLFVDDGPDDVKFWLSEGQPKPTTYRDRWLLPVVLKIPADQVRFEPESGQQVARVGILVASANGIAEVTPVTTSELRVGDKDLENGFVTYSFDILGDKRGSKVSIGVVDRRTGAIGVRTIDNRDRFR